MTIELRDIKNEKVDLQPDVLRFSGTSDQLNYDLTINFFEEVNVQV